jgi:hypothetical protein
VKQGPGVDDVLMPSTPLAYPQVDRGCFASFRVVESSISAVHAVLCVGFDSRQLHRITAIQLTLRVVTVDRHGLNGKVHKSLTLLRLGLPVRTLDGKTLL